MNTAILSPTGGSVGIGFAIPSDMIRTVTAQLEKGGKVVRGYVGVEAQQITPSTAQAMHLKENAGALLAGVQPNSPAAEAGLQPGDVIQAVNGKSRSPIRGNWRLNVANIQPGEQAHLERPARRPDQGCHGEGRHAAERADRQQRRPGTRTSTRPRLAWPWRRYRRKSVISSMCPTGPRAR